MWEGFYRELSILQIRLNKIFLFSIFLYTFGYNIPSYMQELIEKFFRGLGIELTSVTLREESDDLFVRIETPDSPLVIGMHGKNIEIFSHLLGRMCEKKLGHFIHLHLEVNDYMKAKEERLYKFLDTKIAFALETGKTLKIPNLTPYERKKAHNYISEKHIE